MKCRYGNCKLGGEVDKEDAIKDGSMYYHKQCHKKQMAKSEIRNILQSRKMVQRDINIALKRAIDDEEYDLDFIRFVVANRQKEISDPYKLLYQLKIDKNYEEYVRINSLKQQLKVNQFIKTQEFDSKNFEFNIDLNKNKRLNIY